MTVELFAEVVTLALGVPSAWWFTSPRWTARRAGAKWARVAAEVGHLLALELPPSRLPELPMSTGTGHRRQAAGPVWVSPPTGQARHVVGSLSSPEGDPTTSTRRTIRVA